MFDIIYWLYDPFSRNLLIISLFLSIISFILFLKIKNNKKYVFVYSHIFLLLFPFIYLTFQTGCRMYFTGCHRNEAIMSLLFFALISSFIAALFIAPILFIKKYSKKSKEIENHDITDFITGYSEKIKVYLIDTAQPIAFSLSLLKKKIFISVGMIDLLNKKELEAVLLHELGHIKNNSSLSKFSHFFMRFLSPFSYFTSIHESVNKEEKDADMFVFEKQQTWKYLDSAKKKTNEFN